MIEVLSHFDKSSFLWCNRYQAFSPVKQFFRQVSRSGDGYLYLVLAVYCIWLDSTIGQLFLMTALLAFAIELPVYFLVKKITKRERPFIQLNSVLQALEPSDKFSLPSGHTAGAFLMTSMITYFYPAAGLYSFAWALLIGLSRVMLGVHYPSDILAGALLGVSAAMAALVFMEPILMQYGFVF